MMSENMPAPPPRTSPPPPPRARTAALNAAHFMRPQQHGRRIGIYGPGGVGKTSLAASYPGRTVFADLDGSLGELGLDVEVVPHVSDWRGLCAALEADQWNDVDALAIDSFTFAEELALAHMLKSIPADKSGQVATSIESYGYGKGFNYLYDEVRKIFPILDVHVRAGRTVILIMHDSTRSVPNPAGDDYLRYEPRLQHTDKASIRMRVREWVDHLIYLTYDQSVKDDKRRMTGSRTIYPQETPFCMAKSRKLRNPIPYPETGCTFWPQLIGG